MARTRTTRRPPDAREELQRWKLSLLRAFVAKHGIDALSSSTVVAPGVPIGRWAAGKRYDRRRGVLPHWLREGLEGIPGWTWRVSKQTKVQRIRATYWLRFEDEARARLAVLRRFVEQRGWGALGEDTVCGDVKLGRWVRQLREKWRAGALPAWLETELHRTPGWTPTPRADSDRRNLARLRRYVDSGILSVELLWTLGTWIMTQWNGHRYGRPRLDAGLRAKLEAIPGWTWGLRSWTRDR